MSPLIVDLFEPIHVEEQQGHRPLMAVRSREDLAAPFGEPAPVQQPRQRVTNGSMLQLFA